MNTPTRVEGAAAERISSRFLLGYTNVDVTVIAETLIEENVNRKNSSADAAKEKEASGEWFTEIR